MVTFGSLAAFIAVALLSGTIGLLLGAMMASSKIGPLYDRLERAEAANRVQVQLLDELTEALRLLLDDLSSPHNVLSVERSTGARQILERIALAAEMRAHLD